MVMVDPTRLLSIRRIADTAPAPRDMLRIDPMMR